MTGEQYVKRNKHISLSLGDSNFLIACLIYQEFTKGVSEISQEFIKRLNLIVFMQSHPNER